MDATAKAQVAIVGGGPAGVACIIWLYQLGVDAILIESAEQLGGLQKLSPYLNSWAPGFRNMTGQDIARSLHEHAQATGCRILFNSQVQRVGFSSGFFDLTLSGDRRAAAPYLVLATGSKPRSGGFVAARNVAIGPGAPMENLDVLGKNVAILGGGDNAFDQAFFVLQRGARSVTIFCRRRPKAQKRIQSRIAPDRVCVGPFKADQQRMTVNDQPFDVFGVQFGYEAIIPQGLDLSLQDGFIDVDRHGETSFRNVFACGDVTNFWQPCIMTALAHGVQVAKTIAMRIEAESP
jgi:thioredoxin reductase